VLSWEVGVVERHCPVCDSTEAQDRVLEHTGGFGTTNFTRCRRCGSLSSGRAPEPMLSLDAAVDGYVEATAGIGTIADALAMLPSSTRSLLDVGCGYGFGVDLAARLFGWRATGVEPSPAGRRGATELGIDVHHEELETALLPGAPYDAALSSEVLEHVTDPTGFLRAIRQQLGPNGVVVLTTPAAEAVHPEADVETIEAVLSAPHHHFVASAASLSWLLQASGFNWVDVQRRGATLLALAGNGDTPLRIDTAATVDAVVLEQYLSERASDAEPGSLLELGSAVRAYRSMVTRGAFVDAAAARPAVANAIERRGGCRFEPDALRFALTGEWTPPLALPGAAFAAGMVAMLDEIDTATAQRWFEVAERAATQLRNRQRLVDLDSLDVIVNSLGHGALCAAVDPNESNGAGQVGALVARLSVLVDSRDVDWWRCRVFVEAVSAGRYHTAATLLDAVGAVASSMAADAADDRRRSGLDALFTWGIWSLQAGAATEAAQVFDACAAACRAARPSDHAQHLLGEATRHLDVAVAAGGTRPESSARPGAIGDRRIDVAIDSYWSETHGFFVSGFLATPGRSWARIGIRVAESVHWTDPQPRPDVAALFGDLADDAVGFEIYVTGPTPRTIQLVGVGDRSADIADSKITADIEFTVDVELPDRAVPAVDPIASDLDPLEVIATAPPGPVLLIGARVVEGGDRFDELVRQRTGREVVSVDIHPGLGVDRLVDAHRLSAVFGAGTFAVTHSAEVLEHVVAPWLVASECAAVTMTGGLTIHSAPFVWPEHSQPNDFWRFSPAGLQQLFGAATGFDVVASGSKWSATVMPHPSWRQAHLRMPTLPTNAMSWIVARRRAVPVPDVRWPYDPGDGASVARAYPIDALAPK
jgi:2-polyprenyl-3-methyl-5-hydroxy-6-metoxy-1,4-benzoquinol methylase